jgi:hypothetical protein
MKRISGTYFDHYFINLTFSLCLSPILYFIDPEIELHLVLSFGLIVGLLWSTVVCLKIVHSGHVNSNLKYLIGSGKLLFNNRTVSPDDIKSIRIDEFWALKYTYVYIEFNVGESREVTDQYRIMDKPMFPFLNIIYDYPRSLEILFEFHPELKDKLQKRK